eukprot:symbB.v1.2.004897.t1/scaffold277.1/size415908/16
MAEPEVKEAKEPEGEEEPEVKNQEVTEKEVAEVKAVEKADKASPEAKPANKPPRQEASPVMLAAMVLGALALASSIAVAQAANEQGLQRWMDSLFEKHVVPPPQVPNNVCTIQFCQS